jgi:hypothetical protein
MFDIAPLAKAVSELGLKARNMIADSRSYPAKLRDALARLFSPYL